MRLLASLMRSCGTCNQSQTWMVRDTCAVLTGSQVWLRLVQQPHGPVRLFAHCLTNSGWLAMCFRQGKQIGIVSFAASFVICLSATLVSFLRLCCASSAEGDSVPIFIFKWIWVEFDYGKGELGRMVIFVDRCVCLLFRVRNVYL